MKKTCWIPSDGRFDTPPAASNLGLLAAFTSRVPAATCAGAGAGIFSSIPSYSFELKAPLWFDVLPTPLMLTTRREPSGSIAIADGNQAVGTAPITAHLPVRTTAS